MSYLSDKSVLYLFSKNYQILLKNRKLYIYKLKEKVDEIPLFSLTGIVMNHNCTFDPKILKIATQNKISIIFIDGHFNFIASIKSPEAKNIFLRKLQYEFFSNRQYALTASKAIIKGKIINSSKVIRQPKAEIAPWLQSLYQAKSIAEIRGIEGSYANSYFEKFGQQITNADFKWNGRHKHPAIGEVNALLSWGYTLLGIEIQTFCEIIGLDPYLGFMHTDYYGRPSLVCDLQEEYRPWVVDRFVLNLINLKQVKKEHFTKKDGVARLNSKGYQIFHTNWTERMKGNKKYQIIYQTKLAIRGVIELQTRLLSKSLTGEYTYEAFIP